MKFIIFILLLTLSFSSFARRAKRQSSWSLCKSGDCQMIASKNTCRKALNNIGIKAYLSKDDSQVKTIAGSERQDTGAFGKTVSAKTVQLSEAYCTKKKKSSVVKYTLEFTWVDVEVDGKFQANTLPDTRLVKIGESSSSGSRKDSKRKSLINNRSSKSTSSSSKGIWDQVLDVIHKGRRR